MDILINYWPFLLIIIIIAFVFFLLIAFVFFLFKKGNYQFPIERERILREGLPAEAEVISIGESSSGIVGQGNQGREDPVIDLKLRVNKTGKKYEIKLNVAVPVFYLPQVQPGKTIKIKVDPSNQNKAALDFDAMN